MPAPIGPPRPKTRVEIRVELRHARQLMHLAVNALMLVKSCHASDFLGADVHLKIDTATATAADAMQLLDLLLGD